MRLTQKIGLKIAQIFLLLVVSIGIPILLIQRFVNPHLTNFYQQSVRIDHAGYVSFPPIFARRGSDSGQNKPNKVILFWVPYFRESYFGFGVGSEPFARAGCDVSRCETTLDRSRLSDANAIIFHLSNMELDDLPTMRYDDQRYIFFTMESPINTASARTGLPITDLRPLNGYFNWTMTYRRDSDIRLPYFDVQRKPTRTSDTIIHLPKEIRRNKRLVSWLASNCRTRSKRESYINALKMHVKVDVFGACSGRGRCRPPHCSVADALDNHKFYLSFENSVCRDYVTEKLSNVLRHDVVPIVYGGADYSMLMPPNSYLDVVDYASPGHLARRLVELDRNETAYKSYLDWKSSYTVSGSDDAMRKAFCDLCHALHDDDGDQKRRPTKFYEDLHRWWIEDGNCSVDVPLGFPRLMHRMKLARLELGHGYPALT